MTLKFPTQDLRFPLGHPWIQDFACSFETSFSEPADLKKQLQLFFMLRSRI